MQNGAHSTHNTAMKRNTKHNLPFTAQIIIPSFFLMEGPGSKGLRNIYQVLILQFKENLNQSGGGENFKEGFYNDSLTMIQHDTIQ